MFPTPVRLLGGPPHPPIVRVESPAPREVIVAPSFRLKPIGPAPFERSPMLHYVKNQNGVYEFAGAW